MTITYNSDDNFTIKTKGTTVKIGKTIALGALEISTPGEYESGGVQVEANDGIIEVMSEKMTICWIKKAKILTDEELEKINGINVLLIGVGGGEFTETKTAIDCINQIDPSIVIPMHSQNLEGFLKEEGYSGERQDQLKFSQLDLPSEERKVVVLNPST